MKAVCFCTCIGFRAGRDPGFFNAFIVDCDSNSRPGYRPTDLAIAFPNGLLERWWNIFE